jgi:hypothetical protein
MARARGGANRALRASCVPRVVDQLRPTGFASALAAVAIARRRRRRHSVTKTRQRERKKRRQAEMQAGASVSTVKNEQATDEAMVKIVDVLFRGMEALFRPGTRSEFYQELVEAGLDAAADATWLCGGPKIAGMTCGSTARSFQVPTSIALGVKVTASTAAISNLAVPP